MVQIGTGGFQGIQKSRVQASQTLTGIKILYDGKAVHEIARLSAPAGCRKGFFLYGNTRRPRLYIIVVVMRRISLMHSSKFLYGFLGASLALVPLASAQYATKAP